MALRRLDLTLLITFLFIGLIKYPICRTLAYKIPQFGYTVFSVLLDTPFTIVKGNVENIPACNSVLNLLSPDSIFVKNI